ncbi:MAG TPA: hypothetical protein VGH22_15440 [Candidatus Binatia bacterium]|jgi:hypothetical protein
MLGAEPGNYMRIPRIENPKSKIENWKGGDAHGDEEKSQEQDQGEAEAEEEIARVGGGAPQSRPVSEPKGSAHDRG